MFNQMNLLYLGFLLLLICGHFVYVSSEQSCETNDLQALMVHLRQLKTETETSIMGLKDTFKALENQLAGSKGHRVAFNVYQSSANDMTGKDTVIFTTILLNEGEAYNKTDGIFTAPFSGLYQFNGQVCAVQGREADYTLVMDGKAFASGEYMTPSNASDGKCTSFGAIVSVLKGGKVWIKSHNLYASDNDWNSFSGILIHKT